MIGLGEWRAQIRQRLHRLHALLQQRHAAQHRQAELGLHVGGLAHRLVQRLQQERQHDAEGEAAEAGHHHVAHRLRPRGAARRKRPVDDGDVVGGDAAGDADLFVALQQPVVEGAGGVYLALQDVVLDLAVALVEDVAFQAVDLALQRADLRGRGVVLGAQRAADGVGRRRQLLVDVVDLGLQLQHVRIVRLVDLQLVLVLRLQLGALLAQGLHRRVGEDLRRGEAGRVLGRPPALLGLHQGSP